MKFNQIFSVGNQNKEVYRVLTKPTNMYMIDSGNVKPTGNVTAPSSCQVCIHRDCVYNVSGTV